MKEIQLTKGKVAIVDDEDFERVNKLKWYYGTGRAGYARRGIMIGSKRTYQMLHSFISGFELTDHIDGNKLNNQRINLRSCTRSTNKMNAKKMKNLTSKFKGVSKSNTDNYWKCQIKKDGVFVYNKRFKTELEAAIAYNENAPIYFGEFALLNIIQ